MDKNKYNLRKKKQTSYKVQEESSDSDDSDWFPGDPVNMVEDEDDEDDEDDDDLFLQCRDVGTKHGFAFARFLFQIDPVDLVLLKRSACQVELLAGLCACAGDGFDLLA